MYTGANDPTLPPSVRALSRKRRAAWLEAFAAASAANPGDEGAAFRAAWGRVRAMNKQAGQATDRRQAGKTEDRQEIETMPWKIVEEDGEFCVYKENAEGEPAKKMKCYPDRAGALAYQRALYANVEEKAEDAEEAGPTLVSFKAYDQPDGRTRWVLISSGGFEDRDGEVVSTAFLESAVKSADRTGDRGPLLIFHVPGSNIGTTDYQAVVGDPGFLLESGLFDDTEAGRRAAAYYKAHAKETGASIKFLYANRSPDGIYTPPGAILERSLMRRERAAFPWSALELSEVTKMAKISQKKREELETVLGQELAVGILDQLDANAEALKQAGIRSKEAAEQTKEAADPELDPESDGPPALPIPGGEAAKEAADPELDPESDGPPALPIPGGEAAKEATPQEGGEFELVLTPEALEAVAEKAAGVIAQQLAQLAAQLNSALDGLTKLRTAVEKNAQDVQELKRGDDAKIAEKVAHLPRATLRQIQAPELYRATQAKEAQEAPEGAGPLVDPLGHLKRFVYD